MEISELRQCKTLYLDRDGVINKRIIDGYVRNTNEFIFEDGVLDAMKIFAHLFEHIFIVSNQQGIGKGLMTEDDLKNVHKYMTDNIVDAGGFITKVYFCPFLTSLKHVDRKPDIGMALQSKHDYPDVIFRKSIMVGDAVSDIAFGRHLNMKTVSINLDDGVADLNFGRLKDFADFMEKIN